MCLFNLATVKKLKLKLVYCLKKNLKYTNPNLVAVQCVWKENWKFSDGNKMEKLEMGNKTRKLEMGNGKIEDG